MSARGKCGGGVIGSSIALLAAVLLLFECPVCQASGPRLAPWLNGAAIAGQSALVALLLLKKADPDPSALNVARLISLALVMPLPVPFLLGAAWQTQPCPLCYVYWIATMVSFVEMNTRSAIATLGVAALAGSAVGSVHLLKPTTHLGPMRADLVKEWSLRAAVMTLPRFDVKVKVGDEVDVTKEVAYLFVATDCSACTLGQFERQLAQMRIEASTALVLTRERGRTPSIPTAFRAAPTLSNNHLWESILPPNSVRPVLLRLRQGVIQEVIQ